ncbi:MAG: carbohydrate kinase [Epulopiscium sp.]|nr:carbohydrate kinase [Candidatus Epulonipiscium sp.]
MAKYAIGLDNGGTVIKAAIFDEEGKEIAHFSKQTPIFTPKSGYTERDMEDLWQNNCLCVKGALEKSGIDPKDIVGVAVCGHGKGLYLWGKDGKPAYNGIVSTDSRAWKYPEKWEKDGTWEKLYPKVCQKFMACQQVSLLAWMKEYEKEVYDNIEWVFSVKDYIRFRLTEEAYSEATDISGSGLMDIKNVTFDKELLKELGIEEVYDKLAPIKYSYELCGRITEEAAALTGLLPGTAVAGGMFDIDACAIGMNVTTPDELCTIAGTWSINEFISKTPVTDGSIAMNSLYAIPGYYLIEECSATSAGNLEWYLSQCMDKTQYEGKSIYDEVNELVSSVSPEESNVYFLPFFYGSNAHPLGKGAFIGLTMYHTKAHMLRAIYEGVVYSHKTHIDKLLAARERPRAIRMAGGATNSKIWVQMFADVLGLPVETVTVKEIGAFGCAMAAFVAAGKYKDYTEAAGKMVCISDTVYPNDEMHKIYQEKYKVYRKISDALDTVWSEFQV